MTRLGTGTPETLQERAYPYLQVRKRKKRMVKKIRKDPCRYMKGWLLRAYVVATVSSYVRTRMAESGMGRMIFELSEELT